MHMTLLQSTAAVGLVNFANTSPVSIAVKRSPTNASIVTMMFAQVVAGVMPPYPIVIIVWTLKK